MSAPLVSVICPLYDSERTLKRCLEALERQTFRDFEVILIDSSPHEACLPIARSVMPRADYLHAGRRLKSQAARNLGATRARGRLRVFLDPDSYPTPTWLEALVGSWQNGNRVVLGPLACYGRRWLDHGVHLCKFNICLPSSKSHEVASGWSGNILVETDLFDSLGGWDALHVQGDSVFTARLRGAGQTLWVESAAVVEHDHEGVSFGAFLGERYRRGFEYASLEAQGAVVSHRGPSLLGLCLLPARVVNRMVYVGRRAAEARLSTQFWSTLPIVLSGVSAWYTGVFASQWQRLGRSTP